jgi:hypothetical protein
MEIWPQMFEIQLNFDHYTRPETPTDRRPRSSSTHSLPCNCNARPMRTDADGSYHEPTTIPQSPRPFPTPDAPSSLSA